MKYWIMFSLVLFFVSCDKEKEVETTYLDVKNIVLNDVGQIKYNFNFDASFKNDSACACLIRTKNIKKRDSIESLTAYIKGNDLTINIISSPYSWDCSDDSCLTVHDLNFDLLGFKPNNYNVSICINNGWQIPFKCDIH